jgi:hypothetical protein
MEAGACRRELASLVLFYVAAVATLVLLVTVAPLFVAALYIQEMASGGLRALCPARRKKPEGRVE